MRHLLGIEQLSCHDIQLIFNHAAEYKKKLKQSAGYSQVLTHQTVVLLFCEPSTRTRISFSAAAKKLNAHVIHMTANTSSLEKGETLLDTLKTLEALTADFIVVRHSESGVIHQLASEVHASLINAGDGMHEHPSQALLDAFTLQEKLGSLQGKRISMIGDILHSRVARSSAWLFQKLGAVVTFCGPRHLVPLQFEQMGVYVTHNVKKAIEGADVLDVLRMQHERQDRQSSASMMDDYVKNYRVDADKINRYAKKELLICHPGPVNREIELTSDLIDSQQSLILSQVTHGLLVRMGIFHWLSEKR
jgi:aspartate carbamoyltransferase catalytic subunit